MSTVRGQGRARARSRCPPASTLPQGGRRLCRCLRWVGRLLRRRLCLVCRACLRRACLECLLPRNLLRAPARLRRCRRSRVPATAPASPRPPRIRARHRCTAAPGDRRSLPRWCRPAVPVGMARRPRRRRSPARRPRPRLPRLVESADPAGRAPSRRVQARLRPLPGLAAPSAPAFRHRRRWWVVLRVVHRRLRSVGLRPRRWPGWARPRRSPAPVGLRRPRCRAGPCLRRPSVVGCAPPRCREPARFRRRRLLRGWRLLPAWGVGVATRRLRRLRRCSSRPLRRRPRTGCRGPPRRLAR